MSLFRLLKSPLEILQVLSEKENFYFFSCGRVQKQPGGSEADIKSTEAINQFHTRNLMVLCQISRRQEHHDLTLYQGNMLHTIPGKHPF